MQKSLVGGGRKTPPPCEIGLKVLGTRSELDVIRYLDDIEITHIIRNWFIRDYSRVPNTTGS